MRYFTHDFKPYIKSLRSPAEGGRTQNYNYDILLMILKILKKIFLENFILFGILCCMMTFLACSSIGKLPDGERLKRIQKSPNYVDGEFQNQIPTRTLVEEESFFTALRKFIFSKSEKHKRPSKPLPMVKTDLKALDKNINLVVWLGHSSCYVQLGGKRILIDPVLKKSAAPPFMSLFNRSFKGKYPYSVKDMPEIDYIIISHDHWDHLEYPTMKTLKNKVKAIVCPLGAGSHFERWGFDPKIIHEGDWYDSFLLELDFTVHVLPARHFSGRWIKRNQVLWSSLMIETQGKRVFYSGDTGYGPHYKEIGKKFGSVDLAIIENGQYDPDWSAIHQMPEEAVQAAIDMNAKALLPVHSGRFALCRHSWYNPYIRITSASLGKNFRLLTPRIGEAIHLDNPNQVFSQWWLEHPDLKNKVTQKENLDD